VGFTQPAGHPAAGELLPHHFALTRHALVGRRAVCCGVDGWRVAVCHPLTCQNFPFW
jgi:hypothetical protein